MIPGMPDEGGFGEIDCSRSHRKQGPFLCGDNFRSFAAPGKGQSRAARRVKRIRFWKSLTYSPGLFLSYDQPKIPLRCTSGSEAGTSLISACGGAGEGTGKFLALHRIDQLAVFGPADRRTIVCSRGRALG